MYKVLLCLRYLRTRMIALPSVVSVMLGVATIIVVNSVMGGFAHEMRKRIRGAYSDVLIESISRNGFPHYDELMKRIREDMPKRVVAMTPVVTSFGLLTFAEPRLGETEPVHRDVVLIGVDPAARATVGDFGQWVRDGRKTVLEAFKQHTLLYGGDLGPSLTHVMDDLKQRLDDPPSFTVTKQLAAMRKLYYGAPWRREQNRTKFDKGKLIAYPGVVVGMQLISARYHHKDYFFVGPGLDVTITTFTNDVWGEENPLRLRTLTIADVFKSGMSEYDSKFVYLPFKLLQQMRGMDGADGGPPRVDSIHLKLDNYAHAKAVIARIQDHVLPAVFGRDGVHLVTVKTWEAKNTTILAAVSVELMILNILLFFIIAVAGFGILAIFAMIVVEKTRDIGIVKALGGSNGGVMSIFLGYGLSLGVVGSGLGLALAVTFVTYLDEIEQFITRVTGHEVFPRDVYYFDKIPRDPDPWMMAWVVGGAILIAVLASVYPAWRASRLDPVETLRHE